MKKIFALMLAFAMSISLAACGGSEAEAATEAVTEAATEAAAEAAVEALPVFDVTALEGSWKLTAATSETGEDDMAAVMEIYEGTFDMDINGDGTVKWHTGLADFDGGVVAIEDDGSAMIQFVNGEDVLQLAAIVDEGLLVLVDGTGCGYILEAK